MSPRPDEPVRSDQEDGPGGPRRRDVHPAFAVAQVHRSSGSGRSLFQSDLLHDRSVTLSVNRAERVRDLHSDWVHPLEQLVEVEMSLAQWGQLVSSVGIGSGVPVTLRQHRTGEPEAYGEVPGIPYQPRMAENLQEVDEAMKELYAEALASIEAVEEAFEQNRGKKALREAIADSRRKVQGIPRRMRFAVDVLSEVVEGVVSTGKADLEAHAMEMAAAVGSEPIVSMPSAEAMRAVETGPIGPREQE